MRVGTSALCSRNRLRGGCQRVEQPDHLGVVACQVGRLGQVEASIGGKRALGKVLEQSREDLVGFARLSGVDERPSRFGQDSVERRAGRFERIACGRVVDQVLKFPCGILVTADFTQEAGVGQARLRGLDRFREPFRHRSIRLESGVALLASLQGPGVSQGNFRNERAGGCQLERGGEFHRRVGRLTELPHGISQAN